jgi:hypothetical protein
MNDNIYRMSSTKHDLNKNEFDWGVFLSTTDTFLGNRRVTCTDCLAPQASKTTQLQLLSFLKSLATLLSVEAETVMLVL